MTPSPRRLCRACSPEAGPLDDDDLLREILLRLPPLPSSLPRAALVCKRWRSLASDPAFSKRFRIHHRRNPALLGFFGSRPTDPFQPTLEAPNRVPPARFSFKSHDDDGRYRFRLLGCRHGLVLVLDHTRLRVLVWDPVTGDQHSMAVPLRFHPKDTDSLWSQPEIDDINGAVLRAAGNVQHFRVVLVMADDDRKWQIQALACVYSSETGVWGKFISTSPFEVMGLLPKGVSKEPAVLVGGCLYWILTGISYHGFGFDFLEFDLGRQKLAVVQIPWFVGEREKMTVVREDSGGLGLLSVSQFTAKLWKRKADSDGVASWELQTTIDLNKLLSVNLEEHDSMTLRFAEGNNLLVVGTVFGLFTVQLQSLKFNKLSKNHCLSHHLPFESLYTGETGIGAGHRAPDLLCKTHNMIVWLSRDLQLHSGG